MVEIPCCISLMKVTLLSAQLEGAYQCSRSLERGVEDWC